MQNADNYSETLKTDVTGDKNIKSLQDGVAEGVGGQFSKGGILNPIGEATSKEGFNRYEHNAPEVEKQQKGWTESAKDGASSAGNTVGGTVSGIGSSVGGMLGGGQQEKSKK